MVKTESRAAAPTGTSVPILQQIADEDPIRWYQKPNLRYLYMLLVPTCMGIEITSGFDSQLINALQILPAWKSYYGMPTGPWLGFINASYSLGAFLSLPIVPLINEYFGRRWTILIGSCIMIIGSIIQCFAQNTGNYIFARCVLGFGIPMCIVAGSSLIGELAYPKERPVMTSLFNVSYFIGSLVAAGICFATNSIPGDWAWRTPSILQAFPSLIQVCLVLFLPESPRWLISKDRVEEASAVLDKYHNEAARGEEFVKAEIAQIRYTLALEIEASKRSWTDVFATAGMRRRLLVTACLGMFTQFSGNTLISYYLSNIMTLIGMPSPDDQNKMNIGISAWGGVCSFVCALLVTRYHRRTMYLLCTCGMLCVYIAWTVSMQQAMDATAAGNPSKPASISVLFFIYCYGPFYNIGYNALTYTYLVELWPFAERSRGIAVFQVFGRMCTFITIFVNPVAMDNIKWRWLIIYCCWISFEIVFVYFMFPETFGRTLEELAFMFEDKSKAEGAIAAVEKAQAGMDYDEIVHVEDGHTVIAPGPTKHSAIEKEAQV